MEMSQFEQVSAAITSRRSVSWSKMNGGLIPDKVVNDILGLADWAPTHARTEPWRFFVYVGESLTEFGKAHAELYWQNTPEETRSEATYNKLEHNVDNASHLVVAVMKRGTNVKIPLIEEIAAASAAVQNVLLAAASLGIASFWSTGGMTHSPALKQYLELGEHDIVLGLIFLGYTDEAQKPGQRNIPVSEKVKWL